MVYEDTDDDDDFFTIDEPQEPDSSLEPDGYLSFLLERKRHELANQPDDVDLQEEVARLERMA